MKKSFLKDLAVEKISFVRRAANKRRFLLMKASDQSVADKSKKDVDVDLNNKKTKGENQVRPEIKSRVASIMKEAKLLKETRTVDQIIALLHADAALKITDAEVSDVRNALDIAGSFVVVEDDKDNKKVEKKSTETDDRLDTLQKQQTALAEENKQLRDRLEKEETQRERRDLLTRLSNEAGTLPADTEKAVDNYMKIKKSDPEAAKFFWDSLISSANAIARSGLLGEVGRSGGIPVDDSSVEGKIVADIRKAQAEVKVKKSGDTETKIDEVAVITDVLKKHSDSWGTYLHSKRYPHGQGAPRSLDQYLKVD